MPGKRKRNTGQQGKQKISKATEPIPEGLLRSAEQFATADTYGIAPDLADGARSLVRAAWDGSMCKDILSKEIPLADAIRQSTAELDAAAMAYMASVPEEMQSMVGIGGFDTAKFTKDVVAAFTNLKKLDFDDMRIPKDYDNLQGSLSKHEDVWRSGPRKNELFVIQQFCKRMVELSNSLQQRTGSSIANISKNDTQKKPAHVSSDDTPPSSAAEKLSYESSERILGGPQWPTCVEGKYDWAQLFGPSKDDDDEDGPWLTPRMAARIHHVAIVDADTMFENVGRSWAGPRLPKVARPFYKKSAAWRLCFRDCYLRIAMRLQKGLPPQPNCTGEEMALHNIMEGAESADETIKEDILDALPKYPNDDDFAMVKELAVEDEDVLMLFERGDCGFDDSDDDEPSVDNPVLGPGSTASFMLGSNALAARMHVANLHPKDWFLAFRKNRFRDHI